ncbi:MAG: MMPL family transporter [Gammaproteobacteria bacterium]
MAKVADTIGAWLGRWVRLVITWPKSTTFLSLLATVLAGWYAVGHLGINTDTANLISPSLPWRQHFNEFRQAFPVRDRNLLVVIDAASPAAADTFASALLAEMRRSPDTYHSILLQGEGEFFERNGFLYLPTAELSTLVDRLAAAQPLLGLLQARFDGTAVLDVATLTLTQAPSGAASDIEPFYSALAKSLDGAARGDATPLAWRSLIAAGAAPTNRRIVVLQPALNFGQVQPATTAINGIRDIVARLNTRVEAPVRVRLSGSVAMEHEELASVRSTAGIGGLATAVLVALILLAVLRSWRLLAISLVTLASGLALTAAFAAGAVGHLNLLSVAFVVLNVGLGSDYVIHVLLRYKELVAGGHRMPEALVEMGRDTGASLVVCAVTTAAGFYSFIPTNFSGVSELGLIAGTGVFFGLFVSVTLLPALVVLFTDERAAMRPPRWVDAKYFAPLSRRPRLVLAIAIVVLLVSAVLLPRVTFDSNPIHLRDPRTEGVTTLLELAEAGEAPLLNLVAVAPSDEVAQSWAAQLRKQPEIRNVVTIAQLVPRDQDDKLALLGDLNLLLGPKFAMLNAVPPDPAALDAALAKLEAAAAGSASAAQLEAAVMALRQRLATAAPDAREQELRSLDGALTKTLPGELARLSAGLQAMKFDRTTLPANLADRWLASGGRELVEITPSENVGDNATASRFIAAVRAVAPNATGLPVVYQEASATVVDAFEHALLYAFIMVGVIIFLSLHGLKDTLFVVVPIVLATAVTAALAVLIRMPFNYANIIALPLLVGMGVDNGIHVVHRLRAERATELFNTSTMRAVLASALTTIASFGNLAFSPHVGTASMGILLALGLGVSMAFTLIVLPAWLKVFGGEAQRAA